MSGYLGDGSNRWAAVHVGDAAVLYRLAVERAPAAAAEDFGPPLAPLLGIDMPASSVLTQELMGWSPTRPGLVEDIDQGHYVD